MIIFLHGEDTYRLQEKMMEIEAQYREVNGNSLNLEKLDALKMDFNDFLDALNQQSMFVTKKLFFLENVFSAEQFKKKLLKHIDVISKSQNVLVLVEKQKLRKTTKFFKTIQQATKSQEFELLSGIKLNNWVKREFLKYGAEIEAFALNQLISFIGQDLWRMSQEIRKLSSYTKHITEKEVALFVKSKVETAIFETIDALAQRNKARALQLLEKHFSVGDHPLYLLTMITSQFRNLLLVKSAGGVSNLNKLLGIHPYALRKADNQARSFTFEELKRIFSNIFEIDKNMKTGVILPEEGLKMFIANI